MKENGYWSVDSPLATTSRPYSPNTLEQILRTSLDLLEELKWSSLMALSDDEQAEALPRALAEYALMAMESVPAAEAGPSVAEVLADFALMAMESLPVVEAGPSVTEAVADSAQRALGDLPVGEVSTFGAPRPRLLPPGAGFMSREEFTKRLREAGHQKERQAVQTGQAQHVYHIIARLPTPSPSWQRCRLLIFNFF